MIKVSFHWDHGDSSVGVRAGWEECVAIIPAEPFETVVSFLPSYEKPVPEWAIDVVQTAYVHEVTCRVCNGATKEGAAYTLSGCRVCRGTGKITRKDFLAEGEYPEGELLLGGFPELVEPVQHEWRRIEIQRELEGLQEDEIYLGDGMRQFQDELEVLDQLALTPGEYRERKTKLEGRIAALAEEREQAKRKCATLEREYEENVSV